jgi:hypothetical protein
MTAGERGGRGGETSIRKEEGVWGGFAIGGAYMSELPTGSGQAPLLSPKAAEGSLDYGKVLKLDLQDRLRDFTLGAPRRRKPFRFAGTEVIMRGAL